LIVPALLVPALAAALALGQERADSQRADSQNVGVSRDDTGRENARKPLKEGAKDSLLDKKLRPRGTPGPLPVFTAEGEAAALKFVGENHRELAALLKQLKANSPEEYKRAIRELFRTTEKLAQTKATDLERYELDLEGWKIDSEIRLLAAKLTMGDNEELRGKLRQQFARKSRLQVQRLQLERRRAEQRIKRIDETIEKLTREESQIADRQMDEMLRAVRKEKPLKRRPAAVSSVEKQKQRGTGGEKGAEKGVEKGVEKVDPAVAP
jgi:hypothetical protein